ncbi:MAG TPA: response regulator [Candidatus Paceibacterota bacterium]
MDEHKKTILIVEDDVFILDVLYKKLDAQGYTVLKAGDVESGFAAIKTHKIDLVILDILLPGGSNGFLFLENLKQNKELKEIPVVILSNLSEHQDIEKGLHLGAVDFFVKSNHTPNEVVEKVGQILKDQHASSSV